MTKKINNEKLLDYYIKKFSLDIINYADVKRHSKLVEFSPHEMIYEMGEPVDYFYFFVEGKAKVYTIVENGKSLLLRFYKPLMMIGDLEFANDHKNEATTNIMALSRVYCIAIPMKVLEKRYANDIHVLKFINESLADKLESISLASSINLLYPLENRLASYIFYMANDQKDFVIILDQLTDVAELLGSSYRHLLRVLKKFEKNKWIERKKNKVKITDKQALESLAGDLYL